MKEFNVNFSFLVQDGFKVKSHSRNSENEIHFIKGKSIIEFYFDSSSETMDVVINTNGVRDNLYNYSCFERSKRDELYRKICGSRNLHQQLKEYSAFLCENIKSIQ